MTQCNDTDRDWAADAARRTFYSYDEVRGALASAAAVGISTDGARRLVDEAHAAGVLAEELAGFMMSVAASPGEAP